MTVEEISTSQMHSNIRPTDCIAVTSLQHTDTFGLCLTGFVLRCLLHVRLATNVTLGKSLGTAAMGLFYGPDVLSDAQPTVLSTICNV